MTATANTAQTGQISQEAAEKAKRAIATTLRRIQSNPRIAYYICPMTETYEQLVGAHCALNNLDEAAFRKALDDSLTFEGPSES